MSSRFAQSGNELPGHTSAAATAAGTAVGGAGNAVTTAGTGNAVIEEVYDTVRTEAETIFLAPFPEAVQPLLLAASNPLQSLVGNLGPVPVVEPAVEVCFQFNQPDFYVFIEYSVHLIVFSFDFW